MLYNTAFSYTKSRFKKWPVHVTTDTADLSQADQYASESKYVWLYDDSFPIIDDFNWNYFPPPENEYDVTEFSYCMRETKSPLRWGVLRLVPTDKNRRGETKRSPLIASYRKSAAPIYFCAYNDGKAVSKFNKVKLDKHECYLKQSTSFKELIDSIDTTQIEDSVWLIDTNVTLNPGISFDFELPETNTIFSFTVVHGESGMVYSNKSVMLVSKKFIEHMQSNDNVEFDVIHRPEIAGVLHYDQDPYTSWVYAYHTGIMLGTGEFDHMKPFQKTMIKNSLLKETTSLKQTYSIAGMKSALEDIEKEEYVSFGEWDKISDKFKKWRSTN